MLGWLTRLVVALAIFAVMFFDGLSILTARVGVQDQAQTAALAAGPVWRQTQDVDKAYAAAVQSLDGAANAEIPPKSFKAQRNGTVTVVVDRTAPTLVIHRIGPLRKYVVATATFVSRPTDT